MEPSPASWHAGWGEVAAVLLLSAGYALAARRYPPSPARALAFAASQLLVLAVSVSPVATLALEYLLSAHLFQNVVLAEWAPGLAVLGLSPAMAAALARHGPVRLLTRPLVALPLWVATYAVWHVPALYEAALRNDLLLHAEHASYFLAGAALWWPVAHSRPWRLSRGSKAAYVFAAFVLAAPLGLLLAFLPRPVYGFYVDAPRIWGISPLADQQAAGVIMSVSEAIVFFGVFAYLFLRFLAEEDVAAPARLRVEGGGERR